MAKKYRIEDVKVDAKVLLLKRLSSRDIPES